MVYFTLLNNISNTIIIETVCHLTKPKPTKSHFAVPPICRGEACFDPDLPSLGTYMFCSMLYYHHHTDLIFLLFVPNYHSLSDCKTLYVKRTLFLVSTQKNIVSLQNFLENAVWNCLISSEVGQAVS